MGKIRHGWGESPYWFAGQDMRGGEPMDWAARRDLRGGPPGLGGRTGHAGCRPPDRAAAGTCVGESRLVVIIPPWLQGAALWYMVSVVSFRDA